MFENFKTDIIYYNTNTDFEMEFNLCGCCRMRLLNDKCSDKKSLLLSLSRAVSRSRVIIITAPLFSDDSITKTVASAIGSSTEIIDNAKHNINNNNEISVIKDSVPLVTDDGIFGGCLIQSGPQTLILLTESKGVRKTIMQNLIHPYIKEISLQEMDSDAEIELITDEDVIIEENPTAEDEAETVPDLSETEEFDYIADELENQLLTDEDDEDDSTYEYTDVDELIIDAVEEDDESEYFASEYKGLYTETKPDRNDDSDDSYVYDDEYYTDTPEPKPSALNIWILIISVLLLVTLAVLCYCIFYVPTKAGIEPSVYLKEIFDTMFI